jgi:hypothetical protein
VRIFVYSRSADRLRTGTLLAMQTAISSADTTRSPLDDAMALLDSKDRYLEEPGKNVSNGVVEIRQIGPER